MKTNEFIDQVRHAILNNISLGTSAEIQVLRHNSLLGYIAGCKVSDYKIILHDSKYQRRKFNVIDLLSTLDRVKNIKGRSNKDIVYSPKYGYSYDIKSVFFKYSRTGHNITYVKFFIHVE